MTANYYPDGLTVEVITALQQEVDAGLRKEGCPVPATRSARTRRPSSGPSRTTTARSFVDDTNGLARRRAGDDGPQRHRGQGTGPKDATPPAMRRQLRR